MKLLTIPFAAFDRKMAPLTMPGWMTWHRARGIDPARVIRVYNDEERQVVVFEISENEQEG